MELWYLQSIFNYLINCSLPFFLSYFLFKSRIEFATSRKHNMVSIIIALLLMVIQNFSDKFVLLTCQYWTPCTHHWALIESRTLTSEITHPKWIQRNTTQTLEKDANKISRFMGLQGHSYEGREYRKKIKWLFLLFFCNFFLALVALLNSIFGNFDFLISIYIELNEFKRNIVTFKWT